MSGPPGLAVFILALLCRAAWGQAAPAPATGIHACTDARGQPIIGDRFNRDCLDKEQKLLNKDGSVKKVLPATPTPDEQALREDKERRDKEAQAARNEAEKHDRLLMIRFPNETAHDKARDSALDSVRQAMKSSEARLQALALERKPLLDESEFYRNRPVPAMLKQQLEDNDAAVAAQRDTIKAQEGEQVRINANFDAERARLRKLWSGARPGSVGPVPR